LKGGHKMSSKTKKADNEEKTRNDRLIRSFVGESPEELLECMTGKIPEKDIKVIMEKMEEMKNKHKKPSDDIPEEQQRLINKAIKTAINDVKNAQELDANKPPVFKVNMKEIHVYSTVSSTHVVPFLFATPVSLEMTLEETQQDIGNEGNINVETDINGCDGAVPTLVIPHKCENNNNETSIAQIMEYLQRHFSEHINIEDVECYGSALSMKRITFK